MQSMCTGSPTSLGPKDVVEYSWHLVLWRNERRFWLPTDFDGECLFCRQKRHQKSAGTHVSGPPSMSPPIRGRSKEKFK
jgi:hypothetical protein